MYSTKERELILQYNLPLLWSDYTEKQDKIYIEKILPVLLDVKIIPSGKSTVKRTKINMFELLLED